MRRIIFVLAVVVILTFGTSAHSAMHIFQDFAVHGFSIDVPADWMVVVSENEILIISPDKQESIKFVYAHREGMDPPRFARTASELLEGSEPEEIEGGDFLFTFKEDGVQFNGRTRHLLNLGIVMKSKSNFDNILSILDGF
jgi:hypothetical protein